MELQVTRCNLNWLDEYSSLLSPTLQILIATVHTVQSWGCGSSVLWSCNPQAASSKSGWVRKSIQGETVSKSVLQIQFSVTNPEEESSQIKKTLHTLTQMFCSYQHQHIHANASTSHKISCSFRCSLLQGSLWLLISCLAIFFFLNFFSCRKHKKHPNSILVLWCASVRYVRWWIPQ